MKTLSVAVNEDLYVSVKDRSSNLNLTMSDYLRKLINKDLEEVQAPVVVNKPMSALERLGHAFGAEIKVLKPTSKGNSNKLSIPKTFRKPYYDLFLRKEMLYGEAKNDHVYCTHWNINDVLLLKHFILSKQFEKNKAKVFAKLFNKSHQGILRMAWNIQEGYLDKVISDFKSMMVETDFDILTKPQGNKLIINNEVSDVSIRTAKELVDIMNVKGYSESTIWYNMKSYPNNNSLAVRMICENYCNNQLLKLLHEDEKIVFENNPQKRREKAI